MRSSIAFLLLVVCIHAASTDEMKDAMMDALRVYSPYGANIVQDRINDQSRALEMESYVDFLKNMRDEATANELPLRQPYKIMNPALANLVAKSDFYYNTAQRDHTHVPNTSPNEMMFMRKLQQSAKSANRALSKQPELPSNTAQRLADLQSLVDKMDRITRNLRSPAKETAYQNAHAQSRMLHRLDHMLDRTNGRLEQAKQEKFENMLNTMMHYHLNDPHYYDELHDHLLEHHLARATSESDFADHVAHDVLYKRLGTHIADEDQMNNYLARNAARDLAVDYRTEHLNQLSNRINEAKAAATAPAAPASTPASTHASTPASTPATPATPATNKTA